MGGKPNWIFLLSKRLQNAPVIAIAAVVSATTLYSISYLIYPYSSFGSGLILAAIIAALIGYPLGILVTNYNVKLRNQNKQIKRSNDIKSQLISILGHDVKSPLNNIKKMLDLVVSQDINEQELKQISSLLHKDVDSTLTLTNNLINWIKVQKMDYMPQYKEFELKEILDETIGLYRSIAATKDIKLIVDYSENELIHSDPEMCKIVLRNLISNSIKFSNNGSEVMVSASRQESHHQFEIKDQGIGIDKGEIDNILNTKTITSNLGTNNEKGTGIGLYLTKQIVDQLGGKIWLESSPGSGTTFYITLPQLSKN